LRVNEALKVLDMNENIFDIKIYDDKKDDEEINETIIRM